ncbi:UDP-N-acetylmuramoyl-L-alanine--D-glutamate ligase [uncultured Sphingomonas sp.]|uniref:UDP-N-acetylmuramoyl-L-alanine--D-glutamate ligase n=1 Tax=uncultured Sphingomonas sp. TaxID=158754 RepID=UPI0035CA202C
MITSRTWAGQRYAVLGLARSGTAAVRALVAGGANVIAWDKDEERRGPLAPSFQGRGWGGERHQPSGSRGASSLTAAPSPNPSPEGEGLTIADLDTVDLAGLDALVLSPGVPLNTHPLVTRARTAGLTVIGDIELFAQARADLPTHKVVGITGTNGKSTTTALVHHILRTAGVPSLMGGNIGLPILAQEPLPGGGVYVLELSSFQIDLTATLDCEVAVLLNVTPDHLDRYDGFDAYAASKARLFAMQSASHEAVIGIGDDASAKIARSLSGRGERLTKIAPGVCMDQSRWPALQGPHNAQNALAAIAVGRALGVGEQDITRGLESFSGLRHRMEQVAVRNKVSFVNDSKATNAEAAAPALGSFERVHWILGGRAKGNDLDACRPRFDRVVRAYTVGESGPHFATYLREAGVAVEEAGTVARAVEAAASAARPGEVVLLSPAAASFDQFRNFEERGDVFRACVGELA